MIDLHFHCLPGLDDGPESWSDAEALCRAARAEGVTTIVATPHVLRDPWMNEDPAARDALLAELNLRLGGAPEVVPGSEVWFGSDVVELAEKGDAGPLTTLNRSRYLLVEFAPGFVPRGAEDAFHELLVLGLVPVVAHPERNLVFARDPDLLERLVARGALVQVTAGSLLGEFGRGALGAANELLRRGIVHVVASDAHSVAVRPPLMATARAHVEERLGPEVASLLFVTNPEAIVADRPIEPPGPPAGGGGGR